MLSQLNCQTAERFFLNPDLKKIIKFAYENNIILTAFNGVNFNDVSEDVLEDLVKYQFHGLTCSMDAASQETYIKYRVGGDFDKVISNIRKINYYKEKYNSIYPILNYKFIVFGHNEDEIPKAKQLAKELNMDIIFASNWDNDFSPIRNKEFVSKETTLSDIFESNFGQDAKIKYQSDVCNQMWANPQINWDGTLLGCCVLYQDDFGVNVFDVGLKEALNSEKFLYAKKMLLNQAEPREDIPCAKCEVYKLNFSANK